jgi:short-subunit dehydrogenase
MKIFLTGASSGVGAQVRRLLQDQHDVTAPTRNEFDLSNLAQVDGADLSSYDAVINCAGANMGAYLGWHNNSYQNQQSHVEVNFTGALLLAKQYTRQRQQGHFIYVTSASVDDPIAYNIFMVASKAALRYSLNAIKKEFPSFVFTEIVPGKIKSGMLKQNYQGTRTDEEIAGMYDQQQTLSAEQVAKIIVTALELKLDQITIVPHKPTEL